MSLKRSSNSTHSRKNFNPSVGVGTGGVAAPVITSITICDASYNNLDDTSLDPAGSYVKLNGTGFQTGCSVYFNNQSLTATFISSSEVRIQTPAITVGSYNLMLFNPDNNGGAIYLNLSVSNFPTWTTSAGSLGSVYEQTAYANTIVATGDTPLSYSILSGTLPSGISLSSGGVLSGTTPVDASSTTYTFVANVKDAQGQDSTRTFTLTINVDTVTWNTPAQNYVISSYEYSPISNVTANATSAAGFGVLYSPNTLPSGISTNTQSGLISGTINTVGNYYTRYTATANTTGRSATRDVVFNVNQDVVTWSSPADATQYTLSGGTAMAEVTLSAASAAGRTITYTANALPSGLTISGSTISGTPDTAQTVTTLLTATADTTNRSATRTISWSISLGDLYWKNTVLLLSANTPTPSFINDSSNNNLQLTIVGDTRPSNFDPYMGGYYSLFNDGTGQNATVGSGSTAFNLTGDFTIEAWVYPTSFAGDNWGIFDARTAGSSPTNWLFSLEDQGTETYKILFYSGGYNRSTGQIISANKWTHVAVVRNGSALRFFVDGVLDYYNGSFGTGELSPGSTTPVIGSKDSAISTFKTAGYISNLRLVNGTAVYTTAETTIGTSVFTPSSTPLTAVANTTLLTCQDNRYIDDSPNNFTITPGSASAIKISSAHPFVTPTTVGNTTITILGSGYFDGNGDYLTLSKPLVPATGNFTIECWIYSLTAAGSNQRAVYSQFASAQGGRFMFGIDQTSSSRIWFHYNGADFYGTTGGIVVNTWTHIALVRVGDAFDMYINGVKNATNTFTGASLYQGAQQIAGASGATFNPNAYISDLRIVTGTAVYTSNTAPPTAPLTAIANTQLLTLQTNGGAINNSIVDQSVFNNIITRVGNATQGTFSPYSQNGWSNYFDGTGDYLTLPTNTAFAIGTADFTVEMWVMPTSTNLPWTTLFAGVNYGASSDWGLYGGDSTTSLYPMFFFTSSSSQGSGTNQTQGSQSITGYTKMTIGQWNHIAVSRVSGTARMFLNGTQTGPSVDASTWSLTNSLQKGIGGGFNGNSNTLFTGYISNLRVVSGTGLYSANFTPSTTPLSTVPGTILLTCQDNRLIDESPNNFTITRAGDVSVRALSPFGGVTSIPTSYSAYFDGTGDYLTVPDNTSLQMGSGDFTIEFWIYYNSITGYQTPFSKGYTAAGDILFQTGNGNGIMVIYLSGSIAIQESTGAVTGQWYHYALVRSGTTVTLYRNGVSRGTATNSVNFNTTNQLGIGATGKAPGGGAVGDYAVNGYMSNVRVVKGTAVYTGSFTPPTSPLTAITNTSLLTCQSSKFIDNSTNYFTVSGNGNAKPLSFNPFGQTNTTGVSYSPSVVGGSIYFDGTGDYLTAPSSATIYGTMTYTIEFWIYRTAAPATSRILENGTSTTNFSMDLNASGLFTINNNTTIAGSTSTIAVPLNAWTHVALVRTSTGASGTAWYINGVAAGTFTHSIDIAIGTTMQIARAAAGSYLTGYLSDLRFTQGVALYTSAFVPPVAPLTPTTTIGNNRYTSNLLLNGTSGGVIDYHGTNNLETVGNTQLASEDPYSGSYYSNYFDGNGDYLTTPAFTSTLSTWTMEFWLNTTSTTQYQTFVHRGDGATWNVTSIWDLYMTGTTSGVLQFLNGTGGVQLNGTTIINNGLWHHIAITYDGTNYRLFVNGKLDAYQAGSAMSTASYLFYLGYDPRNTRYTTGSISNFRFVDGSVVYSTSSTTTGANIFTPPTSPLTAITNTQLLTCQSNKFIDNSSNALTITRTGDTKVQTFNPFQNNSRKSIYFDGSGDYLSMPSNPTIQLRGNDFTLEAWVYPITFVSNGNPVFALDTNASYYASARFGYESGGNISLLMSTTGSTWALNISSGLGTMELNSWQHLALTRSGTSVRVFLNGVQQGSTQTVSGALMTGSNYWIGYLNAPSAQFVNGYIKDARITNGYARYTTNFTPPATTFEVK